MLEEFTKAVLLKKKKVKSSLPESLKMQSNVGLGK
jgi:hypothetical protein